MNTIILSSVGSYMWDDKTRTMTLTIDDEQTARLREQLPRDKRESLIIDAALERALSQALHDKIQAQTELAIIDMEGFRCTGCGTWTQRVRAK